MGTAEGEIETWLIARPYSAAQPSLKALRISRSEAAAIVAMKPLIGTPGTARRLVNLYRLLRSGLSPEDLTRLRESDYGVVLFLLSMLISFPLESTGAFQRLIDAHDDLPEEINALIDKPGAFKRATDRVLAADDLSTRTYVYRHWAPYVARFSFRTGHLAAESIRS